MTSPDGQHSDPQTLLRSWLPHLALLGLLAAAGWWLLVVIAPVREALLLAASLALLTYPVLFQPLDRRLAAWFPHWEGDLRRYASALLSTATLAAMLIGLLVSVLVALVGGLGSTLHALIGLAMQDRERVTQVVDLLVERAATLARMFPDLHLNLDYVRQSLQETLTQVSVGPAFMQFLVTGTGGFLAQAALTLVTLFYLYSQGPQLAELLLSCLPLRQEQHAQLGQRFRSTVLHLLSATLARALAHGLALGLIAWAIGGFNPLLVTVGATIIALMPVVGPIVAWLPLASVLWTQGHPLAAISLALLSLTASWLVERAAKRLAERLGTDELWLSFLLFLGLVGGMLGFGWRGLILGPTAVLVVVVLIQFIPLLYGNRSDEDGTSGQNI